MAFSVKDWKDAPDNTTPLSAAAMEDLETRLSGYTDTSVAALGTWTTWSPTITNITQGNGTVSARYYQLGKLVVANFSFTMGSTSAITGGPTFSPPVNARAAPAFRSAFPMWFRDDSAATWWFGMAVFETATDLAVQAQRADTTHVQSVGISSTIPFTWANLDHMACTFAYEAA